MSETRTSMDCRIKSGNDISDVDPHKLLNGKLSLSDRV